MLEDYIPPRPYQANSGGIIFAKGARITHHRSMWARIVSLLRLSKPKGIVAIGGTISAEGCAAVNDPTTPEEWDEKYGHLVDEYNKRLEARYNPKGEA